MNEEWFGICAKELADTSGAYALKPREAYYTLREIHKIDPYEQNQTEDKLTALFSKIELNNRLEKAQGSKIISK